MFPERGVKMRGLVVFLLVALSCSLADGLLVTKCELKDKLTEVISNLQDTVARIVCHAQFASGFNTSEVNELDPEPLHRKKREYRGYFGMAELDYPPTTIQPHPTTLPHPTHLPLRPRHKRNAKVDDEVWTLYGLFQLSNHLVCSDGVTASLNLCGMSCDKLTDDDISDDISCVAKLLNIFLESGFLAHEELKRMVRLIFQRECDGETASSYFADCA